MKISSYFKFLCVVGFLLGIPSCQPDPFLPCEENVHLSGLLCKKIIVQNGKPAGYVKFVYNDNTQVYLEKYIDPKENSQGNLFRYYTSRRLDSTCFWNEEEKLLEKRINRYNDIDSLVSDTRIFFQNNGYQNEQQTYFYSKKLDSIQVFLNGSLVKTKRYFFYNNSNLLYKILFFNPAFQLDSQSVFSSSADGFLIERKLDPYGKKLGQITRKANANGQLVYEEILGLNNILLQRTDFILDNSGKVVKKFFTRPNSSLDNFEQFYYY